MALGAKPSVRRPREQAILMVFLTALVTVLCSRTVAAEDKTLSISVLQFGTAHWELDHIRHAGLDEANGYQLELRPVANLPASRLAVTSGSVNGAVADLLWCSRATPRAPPIFMFPFRHRLVTWWLPVNPIFGRLPIWSAAALVSLAGPTARAGSC